MNITKGVVLLTRKGCVPCESLKVKLDRIGATYRVVDVEKLAKTTGKAIYLRIFKNVPQILVNGNSVHSGDGPGVTLKYLKKLLGV